jgi:hypothetical protein
MSSAASLELLKGGKKAKVEAELDESTNTVAAAEATTQPAEETSVAIDVDNMSAEELDALVAKYAIEVPGQWTTFSVEQKRAWLNENCSDGSGEETAAVEAPATVPETPAAEEAKPAADKKGKAKAATEKKGKKPSTKAVAAAPLTGEIVEPDAISDLIFEVENVTAQEALELVAKLTDETEVTFFKLGGVLSVIQQNEWFKPAHPTFKDFVETVHGMSHSKAAYLVSIYNHLAEAKIPWSKVKHIGWSKLKEIVKVVTADTLDKWVAIAEQQSTKALIEIVKAELNKDKPKELPDESAKTTVTKSFKLHADQVSTIDVALEKAKTDTGTTADGAALEFICTEFSSGMTLKQRLKTLGIEKLCAMIEEVWPGIDLVVNLDGAQDEAA